MIKSALRPAVERLRQASASARSLPDFIIIGAQKSGTTSLYNYLIQHPQVLAAARKETHYFDFHFAEGLDWYRAHFPLQARLRRPNITGEATPNYLFYPGVAPRLTAALPKVKLIAILRNPIERAYSHYQMATRRWDETLSFADAIAAEPERLEGEVANVLARPEDRSLPLHRHSYLARGAYAEQLEHWLALVPRERLLVLQGERLFDDSAGTMARVTDFLGIDRLTLSNYGAFGAATYAPLATDLRQRLQDHFEPHNERLYALLSERYDWL